VDIFKTISPLVTVVVLICAAWPLTLPLLALAVKVRRGTAPLEYEDAREFWLRCTLGSFLVAVAAWVVLALMAVLIVGLDFSVASGAAGVVQLALLLVLIPTATGVIFWALALEDFFYALAVFGIFVLLPGLPLALVGWLTGLGVRLAQAAPWLLSPS
jgi:hypothetical protein